jgi:predicted RNase H-like HicB family nuclease
MELIRVKKDHYIYPAVFDYADDGISISFPDLPGCFSCADSDEEAIKMANDALSLHLYSMEEDNEEIPEPTPIKKIHLDSNQAVVLIEVYMPTMREAIENYSIKKTLSIPQWLNKLAMEKNINFSQVLQSALKEQLGIRKRP